MNSQILTETFNNGTPTNTWDLTNNGDFTYNTTGTYTVCNLSGSSGTGFLVAEDFSGGYEEAKLSFSSAGFSAVNIKWNGLRQAGAPSLTVSISTDDVTYTTLTFTDVAADGLWHTIPTIFLSGVYDNKTTLYLKFSHDLGSAGNNIFAFDDIDISGTTSPVYYWDGIGALQNAGSWWTGLNATGSSAGGFTTAGQTFIIGPGGFPSATLSAALTISGAGSKLILGDGVTAFALTLSGTSTLSLQSGAKLNVLNTSTLILQNTTGIPALTSFSLAAGSTIDYAQSSAINIYNTTYENLRISGSADKNQTSDITVNGVLNIVAGRSLSMNTNPTRSLTLNGTFSGTGNLRTNTGSNLTIGGSGAFGTLNFVAGTSSQLNNLSINRSASGTGILLGSNLTVSNSAVFTAGLVDLNDKLLTLNGATTFGAGTFAGSLSSSITISSSASTSGSLLMDQTSATTRALSDLTTNTNLTLGNPLEVWGTVTPFAGILTSAGNLTIKQDASNKGRIGTISTGGFSGNVTVETFALGGNTGWALLGVSGLSGNTMNDWYSQFPMAIEGSATGVTSAAGEYFESVQGWNEADPYGYDTTITIATPLNPGQGFWTYLGTGQTTTSDIIISVSGSPVTSSFSISLTNSAQTGTNLIANPYASPISWTALRNGNLAVTDAVYIYNADGAYASYAGGIGTNGGSDIIPSGQAFFVEALSNTTLTALETNKVASNTALMKTTASNVGLPIKLKINGIAGDYDETAIRFHNSATNGFDSELDARKIFQTPGYVGYPGIYSKYTSISTKNGNLDYSINSLPYALTQNAVIPVLVKVNASGQYTITGQDMQLLPPNACVTLKDKLTNTIHNIKASPYVFTINDTTSVARFELTVCADVTTSLDNHNTLADNNESIKIKEGANGVYVNLNFDKTTKTKISVTNVLGQVILDNKFITTQQETVYLDLESKNQLLFITVETESNKITKKIIY